MQPNHQPFTTDHYRHILQAALTSGYAFIRFPELQTIAADEIDHICLLRHDCDNDLEAAAEIARVEASLGVHSTYFVMLRSALYNLFSLPNVALVQEILAHGHWLGLHFDEQRYPDASPEQLADHVDWERELVAAEFGVPIDVVSFHQPSPRVLARQIHLRCINTYDLGDELNIHYLSDSNMVWREGCPSDVLRARTYQRLQLLLHPEWWTAGPMTIDEKWDAMLRHNLALMQRSLLERERAYTRERVIAFQWAPTDRVKAGDSS